MHTYVCIFVVFVFAVVVLPQASSSSVQTRCDCRLPKTAMPFNTDQQAEFDMMYNRLCATNEDSKLVQVTDSVLAMMVRCGEAVVKPIHCKRVVPHTKNRSSTLMSETKVFGKGSKILGVGFSLPKCGPTRAVCFGPLNTGSVREFVDYANKSPHFANFEATMIEGCSVGCSHLNQFVADIHDEVMLPIEFRSDKDLIGGSIPDHLDRHHIPGQLDVGLKWTWIPPSFEARYPKVTEFFTKSFKVEHNMVDGIILPQNSSTSHTVDGII